VKMIVGGSEMAIRASVVFVSADNLGFNYDLYCVEWGVKLYSLTHSLFEFFESFSATKFCRFCECTRDEADTIFDETQLRLRTKNSYDAAAVHCGRPGYDARKTGIKRNCVLNDLTYFHVTENLVVDAMHDILEGIAPVELGLILVELSNDYLTLQDINRSLLSFNYSMSINQSIKTHFYSAICRERIRGA